MLMRTALLFLARAWFLRIVAALPSLILENRTPYVVKESHDVPRQWQAIGPALSSHIISLHIVLKQSCIDDLQRHLHEEEINDLVKPHHDTLNLVNQWLEESEITPNLRDYSPAKDWINFALPVERANTLLNTTFYTFRHEDGDHLVRAPEWSLPNHLLEHIETIQPTTSFFRNKAHRISLKSHPKSDQLVYDPYSIQPGAPVSKVCNSARVTPLCLRTLYGTLNYTPQVPGKNRIGVVNYLEESSNRSDIRLFSELMRFDAASAADRFKVQVIAGGTDIQGQENATMLERGKDKEGDLDAEIIIGIADPTPLTVYSTGGRPDFKTSMKTTYNNNEPYLTWLQYVLAQPDLPQVITTSYGDEEQSVPYSYANIVCNGFAQLGARGITVIFSTGDHGVGPEGKCYSNDGRNPSMFLPIFPATCPYVTSVGATEGFEPETVAVDAQVHFFSGAGFSNYFPRPAYQDTVVPQYLARLNNSFQYPGLFNRSGRAYPDISAQGQNYSIIWNGTEHLIGGTSASAPCVAGIISLVNDALIAAGRPVLGFLNPWLYAVGHQAFSDVLYGSTMGCGTDGFPAMEAWDAASGFGTPYFPRLKELALNAHLLRKN